MTQPAPPVPAAAMLRFRQQPYDLLRKFRANGRTDRVVSNLLLSTLVRTSIDAFFAINRLWLNGVADTITAISKVSPSAADTLRSVMETPLAAMCADPALLDKMVTELVGTEILDDQFVRFAIPKSTPVDGPRGRSLASLAALSYARDRFDEPAPSLSA